MSFKLIKKLKSGIRVGKLETPHGMISTPFFMPVGTVGSVKATSPLELEDLGAEIILCNTYHLYLRPGETLIKKLGGLHKFIGWDKPILTDSGGYQVFSLGREKTNFQFPISNDQLKINNQNKHVISSEVERSFDKDEILRQTQDDTACQISPTSSGGRNDKGNLIKITEEGVEFTSHLDGSKHFFTPERVIDIQLDLGVDILMPLDVCPSGKASRKEVEKATELTIAWAKRAKRHFELRIKNYELNKRPLLHGIVQGGLYEDLRRHCADELIKLDFGGYSVGGLAVDYETRDMWKIVKLMGEILPENKPRYLMGVGTPDDIIKATKLGMDMFDCVLPTRLARHGSVYVSGQWLVVSSNSRQPQTTNYKLLNLLNNRFRDDGGVIDKNCGCPACRAPLKINNNCEIPPKPEKVKGDQNGKGFSRAYISHLIRSNEILGIRLTTLHNLWQYLDLMKKIREDLC